LVSWELDVERSNDLYSAGVIKRPAYSISIGLAVRGRLLGGTRSMFQGDECQVDVMKMKKKRKREIIRSWRGGYSVS
jgi:hypothetical protein